MQTVKLKELRSLTFPHNEKLRYLSAASGLVKCFDRYLVIADDEQYLAAFSDKSLGSDFLLQLSSDVLPEAPAQRKKMKNDWESLLPLQIGEESYVIALPSGSTLKREKGIQIKIGPDFFESKNTDIIEISFSPLYKFLREKIPDLNIEGSAISGDKLLFFQRGNGAGGVNAVIFYELKFFYDCLMGSKLVTEAGFSEIKKFDLGMTKNSRFSFTDACKAAAGPVWFLAAAESGASTYEDGAYCGAIVGYFNDEMEIENSYFLDCPFKPEGLWVEKCDGKTWGFVVTDADDPSSPARLYSFFL